MTPTYSKMPPHMVAALAPFGKELKGVFERAIKAAFAAGEKHEKGTGHDSTVIALTALAAQASILTVTRAMEVHDDQPPMVVATVVMRDIGVSALSTLFGAAAVVPEKKT
jgi:hypothetical protein